MPVGLNATLSKDALDAVSGRLAQALNKVFIDIEAHQFFLAGTDDAALESLGYTPADVALLKSAFTDADKLRRIYAGQEALPAAQDFTQFLRRLFGTGWSGQ